MLGDQADMLSRLKAVLPQRWFASTTPGLDSDTPVLDGLLSGGAATASWLYSLLEYVALQRRVATATDVNLDIISRDFFGLSFPRIRGELDESYRVRIIANLLAAKNTRAAIAAAVESLTGTAPVIFEPRNTTDTGGYGFQGMTVGTGLGYGVAGGYGSLLLPFQAFIRAFRPHGGGVSNSEGYYSLSYGTSVPAIGGYGQGSIQYANPSMLSGVISDDDIMALIASTAPIATIMWARIENFNGTPSTLQAEIARLALRQADQTIRAGIFTGLNIGSLTVTQAAQSIAAAVNGSATGRLTIAQAAQTIIASTVAAVGWNAGDKSP
jgi:hypothetical protein